MSVFVFDARGGACAVRAAGGTWAPAPEPGADARCVALSAADLLFDPARARRPARKRGGAPLSHALVDDGDELYTVPYGEWEAERAPPAAARAREPRVARVLAVRGRGGVCRWAVELGGGAPARLAHAELRRRALPLLLAACRALLPRGNGGAGQ
jgi:hypothetical protein